MARRFRDVVLGLTREHFAREAPSHGGVDVALRRPARSDPALGRHRRIEQAIGLTELRADAVQPGPVSLLGRAEVQLVDDLYGLLAGGERQAGGPQRSEAGLGVGVCLRRGPPC